MDGVTILSEIVQGGWQDVLLGIGICLGISLLVTIAASVMCSDFDILNVVLGLFMGTFVFIMLSLCGVIKYHPYSQYKVTISDEVSFNEFNEKYEIINQEGQIYTVREKD